MTCAAAATIESIATPSAAAPAAFRALQAKLFTARGRRSVRVVAISDGEATVACDDQPPCGTFAYLVRNGVKLPAMIDWTHEDRLGLRFEAPTWTERTRETFYASRRRAPASGDAPRDPTPAEAVAAAALADGNPPVTLAA